MAKWRTMYPQWFGDMSNPAGGEVKPAGHEFELPEGVNPPSRPGHGAPPEAFAQGAVLWEKVDP